MLAGWQVRGMIVTVVVAVFVHPALSAVTVNVSVATNKFVEVFCEFGDTTSTAGAQEKEGNTGKKEYIVPATGKAPGICVLFAVLLLAEFVEKVILLKLVETTPVRPEEVLVVLLPIAS